MISQERFEAILNKFDKIDPILVIGDVGVDKYTLGQVNRISPEAPVPIIEVEKEWMKLGLAANVSDNLQSLNIASTLCGVIGNDNNGNTLETLLEESGLKTWGMIRDANRMTTFKERIVTEVQQVCRVDYETKAAICNDVYDRLKGRFDEFIESHSCVVLEDYGKGLIRENVASYIIDASKEHGKMVIVDPSRTTPPQWYQGATLLKPNKAESIMMAKALGHHKNENISDVAHVLVDKLKLEKLIITLGPEGMLILDTKNGGKISQIPTVASEVFDVSGAGDTAVSTIAGALISGATLEEAAWVGNCASGVVVGKKGTALVTISELLAFFEKIQKALNK